MTTTQIITGATPGEAFTVAQEEARHKHGNSGATGTIAEATGFDVVEGAPLLDWSALHSARTLVERGRVNGDGRALLVPVAQALARKSVSAPVNVTDLNDYERECEINRVITNKIGTDQSILDMEVRDHQAPDVGAKGKYRTKPWETKLPALGGDKKTAYIVYNEAGERLASFPTVVEARRWMRSHVKESTVPCRLVVLGEITRTDGGPLFVAGRSVSQESVYVKARVALPRQAPVTKWVAVGDYRDS